MMPATMGSNRNSHSSGSMSCVAPLLMSSDHFGHRSEANRTPFRRCRTPCRRTGKVSDMISESLSDINRNRCPTSIGMPVRYESEWVSDQRRNTHFGRLWRKPAAYMAAIIYAPVEDVELFMRGYIAPV